MEWRDAIMRALRAKTLVFITLILRKLSQRRDIGIR